MSERKIMQIKRKESKNQVRRKTESKNIFFKVCTCLELGFMIHGSMNRTFGVPISVLRYLLDKQTPAETDKWSVSFGW